MKVLLNISTLNKGGALQASASFVQEALKFEDGIDWCFAVSRIAFDELSNFGVGFKEFRVEVFEKTPAKHHESRVKLKKLEQDFGADVVFTFFGPAYVKFQAPHLCGVADGWVSHSSLLAFSALGLTRQLLEFPLRILRKAYFYRKADAWVVEAECAKIGLYRRFRFPLEKIFVVPNNCGQNYFENATLPVVPGPSQKIKILCLSAHYPHKNLEIIPFVAKEIRKLQPELSFEFVITLPESNPGYLKIKSTACALGVTECIRNIGPVAVIAGPALYKECHISFLPSLLETFSANYPEAMAMGLPIVTTNLEFARKICRDAALYFEPTDALSAATVLMELIQSNALWKKLVCEGKKVLAELPSPARKYSMYCEYLKMLSLP